MSAPAGRSAPPQIVCALPTIPDWRRTIVPAALLAIVGFCLLGCADQDGWLVRRTYEWLMADLGGAYDLDDQTPSPPEMIARVVMISAAACLFGAAYLPIARAFEAFKTTCAHLTMRKRWAAGGYDPRLVVDLPRGRITKPRVARRFARRVRALPIEPARGIIVCTGGTLPPNIADARPEPVSVRYDGVVLWEALIIFCGLIFLRAWLDVRLDGKASAAALDTWAAAVFVFLAVIMVLRHVLRSVHWQVSTRCVKRIRRIRPMQRTVDTWRVGPDALFIVTGAPVGPDGGPVEQKDRPRRQCTVQVIGEAGCGFFATTRADELDRIWQALLHTRCGSAFVDDELLPST
jgi:hypothetical protein